MIDLARLEKVARAICIELGEDPDKIASISAQFKPGARTKTVSAPQWKKHIGKAQIHIAAHDALTHG